jgi:hypothetical protein
MNDIFLWSHITLSRAKKAGIHTHCIGTQRPDKPPLPGNLSIVTRLEPKQRVGKYDDRYSQLRILWHSVSASSAGYLKRINPEKSLQ